MDSFNDCGMGCGGEDIRGLRFTIYVGWIGCGLGVFVGCRGVIVAFFWFCSGI